MRPSLLTLFIVLAATGTARAQSAERGQLLYATHCIECHSQEMHWRSGRLARDWDGLRAQVTRWQGNAQLRWNADDIESVTRYLNDTIYHFPRAQASLERPAPQAAGR